MVSSQSFRTPVFALPEYRLPKSVLDREIEIIRRLGVHFVFNTRVGVDIPLNDLDAQFDAVFLSIGTWKEGWVYLAGTELTGVTPALPFLEAEAGDKPTKLGDRVVIIGGGNAAIDSARTVVRRGAQATVVYRRERKDMPAIQEEVDAAEQEGVRFSFLAAPHRIVGEQGVVKAIEVVKTRLGEFDSSGRRRPIETDEVHIVPCSSVILAVGESVDTDFSRASGLRIKENAMLEVDRYTLATSREKFFAGGDLISGASNLSNAMGYGKRGGEEHRSVPHRRSALRQRHAQLRVRPDAAGRTQRLPPPPRARTSGGDSRQDVPGGRVGPAA